jgi:hypothetical protein
MSSSPPATPITAATTPIPAPATSPRIAVAAGSRSSLDVGTRWFTASAAAIRTSSTARTLYRVAERIRVAQVAPNQAPTRLPASRLTTTVQCGVSSASGTADRRAGIAVTTTIRLIALFRITAAKAANPKIPISSGSRNSAPPSPIIPPSSPTAAPALNTSSGRRTRIEAANPAAAVGPDPSTATP